MHIARLCGVYRGGVSRGVFYFTPDREVDNPPGQNDWQTLLKKHYLPATTVTGGKEYGLP